MVRARAVLVAALMVACVAAAAAAQDDPSTPAGRPPSIPASSYEFGSSSVPMLRNAAWFSALGGLADRGASEVLDRATHGLFQRRDWKGVVARISQLYLVDMPFASLSQVYNHEYGHITRDVWLDTHDVGIDGWPWPVPFATPRIRGSQNAFPDQSSTDWLTAVAGGSEASAVMADTLMDRAYRSDRASRFDVVLYVYAKLDPSAYAIVRGGWQPGDPMQFAQTLATLRGLGFRWRETDGQMLHSIRTGAWLNLLDYALIGNVRRVVVDHVVHGAPVVRPAWLNIGRVRVVPGFNYTPTPRGQQYRLGSRLATRSFVGHAYVRWTQRLQADEVPSIVEQYNAQITAANVKRPADRQLPPFALPRVWTLVGVGGEVSWPRHPACVPMLSMDVWRDIDGRVTGRAELGVTYHPRELGEGRAVRLSIGGKGRGYVQGFPDASGAYVTAGLVARF